MPSTVEQHDTAIRRQIYLEGVKEGEIKKYERFLKKVDKKLRLELSRENLTDFGRGRLNSQLKTISTALTEIYTEWGDEFKEELAAIAVNAAEFEATTLEGVSRFEFASPSPAQITTAIYTRPLSVRGLDKGKLLAPLVKDFTITQNKHIVGAIRQGYFEGLTNAQIIQNLRGTKANNFKDGVLNVSRNHAAAIVRTSVQHAASEARFQVWDKHDDVIKGYKWVSTLDSRTTQVCRSLDGQVFEMGKGPIPPIHIGCRSTTIAELADDLNWLQEGRTRASILGNTKDQTYYEWLDKQPLDFQDDILGPKRGKLFRDGGISSSEFARLNLGRDFQPLTLEEMRAKDPLALKRAGI